MPLFEKLTEHTGQSTFAAKTETKIRRDTANLSRPTLLHDKEYFRRSCLKAEGQHFETHL